MIRQLIHMLVLSYISLRESSMAHDIPTYGMAIDRSTEREDSRRVEGLRGVYGVYYVMLCYVISYGVVL